MWREIKRGYESERISDYLLGVCNSVLGKDNEISERKGRTNLH